MNVMIKILRDLNINVGNVLNIIKSLKKKHFTTLRSHEHFLNIISKYKR